MELNEDINKNFINIDKGTGALDLNKLNLSNIDNHISKIILPNDIKEYIKQLIKQRNEQINYYNNLIYGQISVIISLLKLDPNKWKLDETTIELVKIK